MVIESKRYNETVEEIMHRRKRESEEQKEKAKKINSSRELLTESLQRYTDGSITSDNLLEDLIRVLEKYGIRDTTRLKETMECLYTLLTF